MGGRRVTKGIYTPTGAPADQGRHPAYTTGSAQGTGTTGAIYGLLGKVLLHPVVSSPASDHLTAEC